MNKMMFCHNESWVPRQIPTSLKLLKATDFYEQRCLKFAGCGQFHSRAELIHAALLEGNPKVRRYTPQPFRFRVGSKCYIPDCYVETERKIVRELKPRGSFDEELYHHISTLCDLHDIDFEVLSNEAVLDQEQLAENWLVILRMLLWAGDLDTGFQEREIIESLLGQPIFCLGDYVEPLDRELSYTAEIAIFRLLHRGVLKANLESKCLSLETKFEVA